MKDDSGMPKNTGNCSLGLTSEVLSTWLARGLDDQETERVRVHVSTCLECQNHLAAYDTVNVALRAQPVPHPSNTLWSLLRLRLFQAEQQVHPRQTSPGWRSLVSALAALAAILLLAVGFFQLFHSRSVGPSAVKLTWSNVSFPANSVLAYGHKLAVSSSDGNVAYVCTITPAEGTQTEMPTGTASVWVTHDRAAYWTQSHPLPTTQHDITACYTIVDDNKPSTALVVVSWSRSPTLQLSADEASSFVTTDSGVTWQTLTDPRAPGIAQFATIRGTIYALINPSCNTESPPTIKNDCLWHLYMISDSWQTWEPIDQVPTQDSHPIGARGFWIDPGTNTIWESALKQDTTTDRLWKTSDGGLHWYEVKVPTANFFKAQMSSDGHTLYICGFKFAGSDTQNPQHGPYTAVCSTDSGASWHERPTLNVSSNNASVLPIAIGADGAILEVVTGGNVQTLYRLNATSRQWQSLGQLPGAKTMVSLYRTGSLWVSPSFPPNSVPALTLKGATFVTPYP